MMNCKDCQELFSLYLDDEIDAPGRTFIQSHLESCRQCELEYQAFKNTVHFLQNFPAEQIPSDFLVGIHAKLEEQSPWEKVRSWLAWPGQRKVALSSAFAMLAIGFATASLIQIIPGSQTETPGTAPPAVQTRQLAQQQSTSQNTVLAHNTVSVQDSIQDYYPGIPLLSEYKGTATPLFQHLAMTRSQNPKQQITPSYLNVTASPVTYSAPQPAVQPDLQITIHHSANNEHIAMMRQITQSTFWQTKIYDNSTLLLSVPSRNFDKLRKICCQTASSFSPAHAKHQRYLSPKRNITVAIRLE